jgi:hypothetical protein
MATKKKSKPEAAPAELKAKLAGIFRDDPTGTYYTADGETFLNENQYEALKDKEGYSKYSAASLQAEAPEESEDEPQPETN